MRAMPDRTDLPTSQATYFQQIVHRFGDSPTTRTAILEGTGISEAEVDAAPMEIALVQQLRQFDNMDRLFGEDWALNAPELWRPAAHGALGVAVSSAPDVARAVLDLLFWEYHETVMAGSGTRASAALDRSVKEERANIWWWWKGWIPTNDGGVH